MFCKWCGETVNPAQRKCANCGRELPALSDCGGFYELVPAARPAEPVRERPEREPMRPPAPGKPPKRGASGGLTAAVLILLAVSLLFQVFAFFYLRGHLPEQSATTDGALQAQISELIAELKGSVPNRDSGGTPNPAPGASGFPSGGAPENRSYTFLHDASDHTEQSDTGEWFPDYSEDKLQVEYRQKDGAGFTAELTWEADDDGWEITASYDLKDEKETFGAFRSSTAEWELYDEATDAWGALPDGVLTVHPSEDNEFSCTVSKAVFPKPANGEVAQIRCLITRENEAGGKMTIILGNALLRSEDAD